MNDITKPGKQSDSSATIAELTALARAARREKRWAQVEQHAAALIEREPDNVHALGWLAEAHEKQGHDEQAIAWYERALKLDARRHDAVPKAVFRRLDILYNRTSRYDDCLRVCQRYAERYPETPDAWTRLSRAASNTGDDDLSLSAEIEADGIRSEREYRKERDRARGERLLELYEARLAELGYGPDETDEQGAQPAAPGAAKEEPLAWLKKPGTELHDDAWLAREQALMDAIEQLLQEEADERESWF